MKNKVIEKTVFVDLLGYPFDKKDDATNSNHEIQLKFREYIQEGNLIVNTEKVGKISFVNITRDYPDYNVTYNGEDKLKIISKASNPYKFLISNQGKDPQDKTVINIDKFL